MPPLMNLETLESRRLLSGLTLITHGQGGDAGDEVAFTADLVDKRAGGASQYVMKVADVDRELKVVFFKRDADSPRIESLASGEQIIRLDWSDVKTMPTPLIARAVADYMVRARLVQQQLHLAGPSRGASVISNLAAELGRRGVWVDQVTYIDPVPANIPIPGLGSLIDGPMRVTENVTFADNYWRSDGNIFNGFDGQPVDGAWNVELKMVQRDNFGDPHVGAGAYYIATVDPRLPIVPPAKASWFRGTSDAPARDRTGYRFSRIAGGGRPLAGISEDFGGTADRDDVRRSGAQWPNIDDVKVANRARQFMIGENFTVAYRFNDADSALSITIGLDNDRNPFNNWVTTVARRNYSAGEAPTVRRAGIQTQSLDTGRYFVGARIRDAAGQVRYAYAPHSIELVPPTTGAMAQSAQSLSNWPRAGSVATQTKSEPLFSSETIETSERLNELI